MQKKKLVPSLAEVIDKLKANKKLAAVLIVGLTGILLIAFSSNTAQKAEPETPKTQNALSDSKELETRLEQFLCSIESLGKVNVMITYESGGEKVYAKDSKEESGKNAYGDEIKSQSEHIIVKSNSNESGLEVKEIYPKIRGVAIICSKIPDSVTKEQVIDLVSSLFDISSTHISVASNDT